MTFHRPGARVCARTGLVLAPSAREPAYRVALSSYGPLNPPVRGPVDADVSSWSRYDTHNGRTVYTASTPGCAFDEVLAAFRRRLGTRTRWSRTPPRSGCRCRSSCGPSTLIGPSLA